MTQIDFNKINELAENYKPEMTRFLRDMIKLPSESCQEKAVALRIKEEMEKVGVKKFKRKSGSMFLEEGQPYEFATNSGKIEFYSSELEELGFDPMPVYTSHDHPEQGFYRLNYGRSPMHTFSRTINNPNLNDLMDENKLWVNPKVARIEGLINELVKNGYEKKPVDSTNLEILNELLD